MPKMGRYCKAYPVQELREFGGWSENVRTAGRDKAPDSGDAGSEQARPDFLYLQENYVVTAGIFIDEDVVFDDVTPEWIDFCKDRLHFEVPNYS